MTLQRYVIRLDAMDEITLIPRIVQLLAKRGCVVRKLEVRTQAADRITVEILIHQISPIPPVQILSQLQKLIDVEQAKIIGVSPYSN